MSNSLPASKDSSPPNSVRSFGAATSSNHVPSTAPKAKPEAITAPALAQRDGADAISQPIADHHDHRNGNPHTLGSNGVLNDDEGSDPNTPRLPPTKLGNSDLENIAHEAAVSLDLLDEPNIYLVSSQQKINRHPLHSGAAASNFPSSFSEPGAQALDKPSGDYHTGPATGYIQDRSHIKSWLEKSQQAYNPHTHEALPQPHVYRAKSYGIASKVPMSETTGQEEAQVSIGQGSERAKAMGARADAFSEEKRNRSSSRSSQSRVEKRIEATMADAEPSSHARSRKSSHVLGLFKENKSSLDVKRSQERQRTTSDHSIDSSTSDAITQPIETLRPGYEGRSGDSETLKQDEALRTAKEPLPMQNEPGKDQSQPSTQTNIVPQLLRKSSTAKSNVKGFKKSRSETDLTTGDWRPAVIKRPEKPESISEHKIPPRLLEEIRNFHNLTTPFHDKFRSAQHRSTVIKSVANDKEKIKQDWKDQLPEQQESGEVDAGHITGEQENEDEESEHISSALYYPHQAPSPDALEDISIDDARKRRDAQLGTEPSLPSPALPVSEDEKAEDVDIALQVHNKNRYLHGDLQKARPPSAELETDRHPALETGFSSASDSEYESVDENKGTTLLDDSSLTDDAEATPRASPKTRQSYLLSRSRKARRGFNAPIGAVELKPYNHQVGGHTTVFRFSKRAVCKQLTNRENEFYEIIERQHPDLLRFLPRYVFYQVRRIRYKQKQGKRSALLRIQEVFFIC